MKREKSILFNYFIEQIWWSMPCLIGYQQPLTHSWLYHLICVLNKGNQLAKHTWVEHSGSLMNVFELIVHQAGRAPSILFYIFCKWLMKVSFSHKTVQADHWQFVDVTAYHPNQWHWNSKLRIVSFKMCSARILNSSKHRVCWSYTSPRCKEGSSLRGFNIQIKAVSSLCCSLVHSEHTTSQFGV